MFLSELMSNPFNNKKIHPYEKNNENNNCSPKKNF